LLAKNTRSCFNIRMTQHTYNDALLLASQATVKSLLDELFGMDGEIEKWAEQLNRAQPLLSGRVVIAFTQGTDISINGKRHYLVDPTPAKMIRIKSGTWKRVWLTKAQTAKGIVELRVGKSLPSDRVVVRLLKGIEDLMQRRNKVLGILMGLRRDAVFAKNACANARIRSDEALDKLKARIKTDWTTDAPQALENLRNRKHNEYIRAKASAELKRRLALEPPPDADTADT
jgi:hypothetical protein